MHMTHYVKLFLRNNLLKYSKLFLQAARQKPSKSSLFLLYVEERSSVYELNRFKPAR